MKILEHQEMFMKIKKQIALTVIMGNPIYAYAIIIRTYDTKMSKMLDIQKLCLHGYKNIMVALTFWCKRNGACQQ